MLTNLPKVPSSTPSNLDWDLRDASSKWLEYTYSSQ
jgi:hypothetical protein